MSNEKRLQQIRDAARYKYPDERIHFIDGAKWADSYPNWISVEEELPKCNIVDCGLATYPVLVYREDGFIDISCYDSEVGEWDCVGVVTHWMPIVPPRKEANDE